MCALTYDENMLGNPTYCATFLCSNAPAFFNNRRNSHKTLKSLLFLVDNKSRWDFLKYQLFKNDYLPIIPKFMIPEVYKKFDDK